MRALSLRPFCPCKGRLGQLVVISRRVQGHDRGACELLLPPITHTMCELLARVEPEYQEQVRQQIILAGGSSQIAGFRPSLEHALGQVGGGQVTVVEDRVFAGAQGGLALAVDTAEAEWEVLAL